MQETSTQHSTVLDNPMRAVKLGKLCISTFILPKENRMSKGCTVMESLTGQKPFVSKSSITMKNRGIRRNEEVSCSVTVRGEVAERLLGEALKVHDNIVPESCFSSNGCFGFTVKEHIDLGIKYDPTCGIFSLQYFAVLERPGNRVSKRKRCRSRVGNKQRISKEDAQKWFVEKCKGVIKEQ